MLSPDTTTLVLVDLQQSLLAAMPERDALVQNARKLILGAKALALPILWLEQNPQRLGPTADEIAAALEGVNPIPKLSFSACGSGDFMGALRATKRRQVVLAGVETHVCVHQTAADLVAQKYETHVVADAVASRTAENRRIGLRRMRDGGVRISSVEMALFEMLRIAEGDRFKAILKIVK